MIDRNRLVRQKFRVSKQMCWQCKNAVPDGTYGCSWSKKLEPVKGWTAKRTANVEYESWEIIDCPEFIPEEPDPEEEDPVVKVKPKPIGPKLFIKTTNPEPVSYTCGYWLRDGM